MDLGHGNSINFAETTNGVTYYLVEIEGEPTMRIACSAIDPERVIHVSTANGAVSLPTKGHFEMTVKMTEDSDGMPLGVEPRVNSKTVYKYVLPRIHLLLGRLLRATTNPCAGGNCSDPEAHAEGAHDL